MGAGPSPAPARCIVFDAIDRIRFSRRANDILIEPAPRCDAPRSPCSKQGKITEARDLLAPVHGRFTEGFHIADLNEATTLLDELS